MVQFALYLTETKEICPLSKYRGYIPFIVIYRNIAALQSLKFRSAILGGGSIRGTENRMELAPAGNKFKERTRIANYTGLPELMSMFKQVADVRTADTLDLATPEMKYHIENIEATEFQKTLVQELSDRADDVQSGNDPV